MFRLEAFASSATAIESDRSRSQPQNLMLTGPFPCCDVKLCDFESCRFLDCEIREMLGTPDYVGAYNLFILILGATLSFGLAASTAGSSEENKSLNKIEYMFVFQI